MSAIPDHAEIYRKLHANRYEHVEQARRARDEQERSNRLAAEGHELRIKLSEYVQFWRKGITAQSDT
jgi:hypothetical protein